jgi:hypothetical protein
MTCWLSHEQTVPEIVSVCPNAILPNMHPRTIMHAKIFIFMLPFNSLRQGIASFSLALVRWDTVGIRCDVHSVCLFYGVLAEPGAAVASIFVALIT